MTTRTAAEALEKLIRLERDLEKKCHDLGYYNMIHVGLREFVEHAAAFRAALAQPQAGEVESITFDAFRAANVTRCLKWHPAGIESWSPSDWLTAVTGELGELASLLKMRNRERDGLLGNKFSPTDKQVADELADVFTYLDLLAAALGVDLGRAAVEKFNEVSERVGFPDRISLLCATQPMGNSLPGDDTGSSVRESTPTTVSEGLFDSAAPANEASSHAYKGSESPAQSAPAQEHVAWLRYVRAHERPTRIQLCDSDTPGAFKVYAAPPQDEAVALLRELVRRYDDYRGKGVMPAPGEYQMVVGAIERIRAFLKDRT